ncbi:hypothetical protein B0H10DRAFT_1939474 [Mycena sp. CBHHK59/15]|nr:hypothetical protein B0H10DRAFT_1939474 [Mycena sp. CBHHK59/15]
MPPPGLVQYSHEWVSGFGHTEFVQFVFFCATPDLDLAWTALTTSPSSSLKSFIVINFSFRVERSRWGSASIEVTNLRWFEDNAAIMPASRNEFASTGPAAHMVELRLESSVVVAENIEGSLEYFRPDLSNRSTVFMMLAEHVPHGDGSRFLCKAFPLCDSTHVGNEGAYHGVCVEPGTVVAREHVERRAWVVAAEKMYCAWTKAEL